MPRKKLITGLVLIDAALLIITVNFFLPRVGNFQFRNAIEYYFNSRTEWSRAWVVLLASILVSIAIVIMFGRDEPKNAKSDTP